MGKAEKLKQQRKIEKVRNQLKKEKRLRLAGYITGGIVLGAILGVGVYFGASFVKNKFFAKKAPNVAVKSYKTSSRTYSQAPDMQIDTNKTYIAKFETNDGNFEITLNVKDAPKTVNNFVVLAKDGYYDGLTFHRIVKDFMIQGGDPLGTGSGGPGYKFADEFNPDLRHNKAGILSMANSGPNTNGSQFFITEQGYDSLNQHYTLFGQCDDASVDIVKAIARVPRNGNDKPLTPVVLKKVTIVREGQPLPPAPVAAPKP